MPKFEELLEICTLLSENGVKKLGLSKDNSNDLETTKLAELFNAVLGQKALDEEDALKILDYNSPDTYSYKKFKARSYDELLNNLLLIESNQAKYKTYGKAYLNLHKQYVFIKILVGLNSRRLAMNLGEKVLKKSISFGFTEIALMIAKELRIYYSSLLGDKRKYEYIDKIVQAQSQRLIAETKVEKYYCELCKHFVKSRSSKPELGKTAKKYVLEAKRVADKHQSTRLYLFYYLIKSIKEEIENDHENLIETCKETIEFINTQKNKVSLSIYLTFHLKLAKSYIRLEEYDLAKMHLNKVSSIQPKSSINWFIIREYICFLLFRTSSYRDLLSLKKEIENNPHFKTMPQQIQERWRIHEAYLQYLIAIGKVDARRSRKFRLHKFLNEVPIYSRDKRGANISILILQVLFLLNQRDYDRILDRIEALRMYHRRYLRRNDTARSNLFIRMLMLLPETDFHRERIIHRGRRHLAKLQTLPLQTVNQSLELEIIPYPELWQYLIDALE